MIIRQDRTTNKEKNYPSLRSRPNTHLSNNLLNWDIRQIKNLYGWLTDGIKYSFGIKLHIIAYYVPCPFSEMKQRLIIFSLNVFLTYQRRKYFLLSGTRSRQDIRFFWAFFLPLAEIAFSLCIWPPTIIIQRKFFH